MYSSNILNALFKPLPQKFEELEYLLETTSNNIKVRFLYILYNNKNEEWRLIFQKELSVSFELLVKCIFGYQTELNLTHSEKLHIQWPLKLINKYNQEHEYNYTYRFLNTDSLFWSILFKLPNLSVNFKLPLQLLPIFIKNRIESGQSVLTPRLDTLNCLNLSNLTESQTPWMVLIILYFKMHLNTI